MVKNGGTEKMNEVINSISTVGFPIFMCIMIYQNQTKQLNEITKAITNNTNAISELSKKLGMEEKEDD